jgi:hypothetical protein
MVNNNHWLVGWNHGTLYGWYVQVFKCTRNSRGLCPAIAFLLHSQEVICKEIWRTLEHVDHVDTSTFYKPGSGLESVFLFNRTWDIWLVVWNLNFIFHNAWDVILPIDELIFFKMVKTTNQDIWLRFPTIYKAYFSGLNFSEYSHNSYGQTYGTFTYLHVLDPEDLPLI